MCKKKDCKGVLNNILLCLLQRMRYVWLFILTIIFSIIVICNWNCCINFKEIDGYNIIFCFWLLLIIFPFIAELSIGKLALKSALIAKDNELKSKDNDNKLIEIKYETERNRNQFINSLQSINNISVKIEKPDNAEDKIKALEQSLQFEENKEAKNV